MNAAPRFSFRFYKFIGERPNRHTELTRTYGDADGMRTLVDQQHIALATQRVNDWANTNGISCTTRQPYPSPKYAGRFGLEFYFGSLTI